MWKWQVKAKNGHFFGEHKLWGSKFFESIIIHPIDTSHNMGLEKIAVTPSAPILTNAPVKNPREASPREGQKRFIYNISFVFPIFK